MSTLEKSLKSTHLQLAPKPLTSAAKRILASLQSCADKAKHQLGSSKILADDEKLIGDMKTVGDIHSHVREHFGNADQIAAAVETRV